VGSEFFLFILLKEIANTYPAEQEISINITLRGFEPYHVYSIKIITKQKVNKECFGFINADRNTKGIITHLI